MREDSFLVKFDLRLIITVKLYVLLSIVYFAYLYSFCWHHISVIWVNMWNMRSRLKVNIDMHYSTFLEHSFHFLLKCRISRFCAECFITKCAYFCPNLQEATKKWIPCFCFKFKNIMILNNGRSILCLLDFQSRLYIIFIKKP